MRSIPVFFDFIYKIPSLYFPLLPSVVQDPKGPFAKSQGDDPVWSLFKIYWMKSEICINVDLIKRSEFLRLISIFGFTFLPLNSSFSKSCLEENISSILNLRKLLKIYFFNFIASQESGSWWWLTEEVPTKRLSMAQRSPDYHLWLIINCVILMIYDDWWKIESPSKCLSKLK